MSRTRGVIFIHSVPSAMCPHIEWAIGGVFGAPVEFNWTGQPLEPSTYRCELAWSGLVGTATKVASTLKGWDRLRFEATEEPTSNSEGERYSYTPSLGLFHATTGIHGDIMISEDRLRSALFARAVGGSMEDAIHQLLGTAWDEELEPFRYAQEAGPVRWLHEVV